MTEQQAKTKAEALLRSTVTTSTVMENGVQKMILSWGMSPPNTAAGSSWSAAINSFLIALGK